MLWGGDYPKWLKERIAGPFGHLDNGSSETLLASLELAGFRDETTGRYRASNWPGS